MALLQQDSGVLHYFLSIWSRCSPNSIKALEKQETKNNVQKKKRKEKAQWFKSPSTKWGKSRNWNISGFMEISKRMQFRETLSAAKENRITFCSQRDWLKFMFLLAFKLSTWAEYRGKLTTSRFTITIKNKQIQKVK